MKTISIRLEASGKKSVEISDYDMEREKTLNERLGEPWNET